MPLTSDTLIYGLRLINREETALKFVRWISLNPKNTLFRNQQLWVLKGLNLGRYPKDIARMASTAASTAIDLITILRK